MTYGNIFPFFPRKQVLTFQANCLHWRQIARNVKSCFLGKKKKKSSICHLLIFFFFFFFDLGFTAFSRIFHLYRADRSSKVGENQRTRGKTWQNLAFPHDMSEARTPAVRNLMDYESTLLSTRLRGPAHLLN